MAKLQNVFSWSHSAATDFELCRRKRYWSKYGAWGGWERDASRECKTAYRLNKMDNRFSLQGVAVEDSVMWMLRQRQQGVNATEEQAFDTVARRLLRQGWDQSTQKVWRQNPKACCLHEHYYPRFHSKSERDMMIQIADNVKRCIHTFREQILPRLAHVTPDMEIPIQTVGKGDPEHFMFEGVKIYAIPDYVYVEDGRWHILDWKSGGAKPEHAAQIGMYGLWASVKHGIAPEQIALSLEYLQSGESVEVPLTAFDLEQARERLRDSVQDMSQYLEGADIARNVPLDREEWDPCYDPDICSRCPFYELCAPELAGLFDQDFPAPGAVAD
jgi:CRISPR/Cas system-associated exonuclease Cas4 (RecB family)